MAGDWIEYEKSLAEKPEVILIGSITGLDRFGVVGRLLEIWAWFDSHTEDGNAVGVTKAFIDAKVSVTGFCDAMIKAGWIKEIGGECNGLSVTDFTKHMGASAKKRLKNAKRVQNHRKRAEEKQNCNAQSVTEELPQNRTEHYYTHTHTDGRVLFQMHREWVPDDIELSAACLRYGVIKSDIDDDVKKSFIDCFSDRADMKSEAGWCSKLVSNYKTYISQGGRRVTGAKAGYIGTKAQKYQDICNIIESDAFACGGFTSTSKSN